ncbi:MULTISPECIES: hypothetical protein [unclassified Bradyrhizobium]|uniref:hypothetical protein n=1 Tax=unclassified Bradyrhizobium TaxID=2631580 RepID=UPI0039656F07
MTGPRFRGYHLLLDDQASEIFTVTDDIAERLCKTGNTTLRSRNSRSSTDDQGL